MFSDYFKNFPSSKQLEEYIKDCRVLKASVDEEKRVMQLTLSFLYVVPDTTLSEIKEKLKELYLLSDIELTVKYPKEKLNSETIRSAVNEALSKSPTIKRLIINISFDEAAEKAVLTLSESYASISNEQKLEKKIRTQILSMFDREVDVEIELVKANDSSPSLEMTEVPEWVLKKQSSVKKSASTGEDRQKPVFDSSKYSNRRQTPVEVTQIGNITADSGKVKISGRIFKVEDPRKLRNGDMLCIFYITDYTGSFKCKKILPSAEGEKIIEDIRKQVKSGLWHTVLGSVEYDRYEKDHVIRFNKIDETEPPIRMDSAPKKRVELHLHTNMSSMDGITPTGELVNRAYKWGHSAVAITDHGVVQAYPEAMMAQESFNDENFKILYGVEGYLINDTDNAVYGNCTEDFDGEFVVFDLETTGLYSNRDQIIEIGAVLVEKGKIKDSFSMFVDPKARIPAVITKLTGITNEMTDGAPDAREAVTSFLEFAGTRPLVAHNAGFDMGFLTAACKKYGIVCENSYIDTVTISRTLFPEFPNHKLNTLTSRLGINLKNHHRASDDAEALAEILLKFFERLSDDYKIENVSGINGFAKGRSELSAKSMRMHHIVILAKTQVGLKNLYKVISASHLDFYFKKPRIPRSLLEQYRDGLILGSACEAGELYEAVFEGKDHETLLETARFYDYLEIMPDGNNMFLVNTGKVSGIEALHDFNRTIVKIGEELNIPVAATGDVHFLEPSDEVFRRILMAGQGFSDADNQAPLYFKTTDEMLSDFEYLGHDKAYEVVVKNTNLVADMCGKLRPVPKGKFPPIMPGADKELEEVVWKRAHEIYGETLPGLVQKRIEDELHLIISCGFYVMYMIARKLVKKSMEDGYYVGSRGSVGSSFVAFLSEITEVNPLVPHYICKNCKNSEFIEDGSCGCGADLPDKDCPVCGSKYYKDGFEIPFATFLGFKGDKDPDIDLNFSGEYQPNAHKYTAELFGRDFVFRAGTIATVKDKTAFGYVKNYGEERGKFFSSAEQERLITGCTGVKRTTGQHPGGVMVVPKDMDIYDFTPVQHPADDINSDIITTHFDYHSIHETLLKLDILGHDDPTMIRFLEDMTGLSARTIPLDDKRVMSLFTSIKELGIDEDEILGTTGAVAIPEFGTKFVREMLVDTKPEKFTDLIRISGLSHGTDVWLNNAQMYIKNGEAKISEIISTRDDIMVYLIHKGMEQTLAFSIMESVRKGRGLKPEWEEAMWAIGVPEWYIDSCNKIKYMFPKAHAAAYDLMAFRIAYYKVYYPKEFYAAYFTIRADAFDAATMIWGIDTLVSSMNTIKAKPELTAKEQDYLVIAEVCYEMYKRNIEFLPIDLYESKAKNFTIKDGKILPPFNALDGVGENAAAAIEASRDGGTFISIEDLQKRSKASKSVIEAMRANKVLQGLPETSQLSLF